MDRQIVEIAGERFENKLPGKRRIAKKESPLFNDLKSVNRTRLIENAHVRLRFAFLLQSVSQLRLDLETPLGRSIGNQEDRDISVAGGAVLLLNAGAVLVGQNDFRIKFKGAFHPVTIPYLPRKNPIFLFGCG